MSIEAASVIGKPKVALFAYGFRPFFLLAGVYAIVPMAVIFWVITFGHWPADGLTLFVWHGHEMLFGFVAAAIAGFLLTAVPTWTGTKAVSGAPLAFLVLLWLAGRVVMSPWVPSTGLVAQMLGVVFFPALALTLAFPLIRTRNIRNLPFLLLLTILFLSELAFHARYFGWMDQPPLDGLRLMINTVMVMIVLIGGRIIPAFTRNALLALQRDAPIRAQPLIDRATIISVAGVLLGDVFALDSMFTGVLAASAAGLVLIRLTGWGGMRTLDIPLLWVLHIGIGWLVIALTLKACWLLGGFAWAMNWMHAFTAGVFGTMILGVMTRVGLGHTGRPLQVAWPVVVSYILVSGAALTRVFGPWLAPQSYTLVLSISIAAWAAAFVIFLLVYTPILFQARPDGRPG